nr:hypothetical protein [Comamonas thiooxydans]
MSDETNSLSEAIKPLIGMVAGSIATNGALLGLLTKKGIVSSEELLSTLNKEFEAMDMDDPKIRTGLKSYLDAMKATIKMYEDSNG